MFNIVRRSLPLTDHLIKKTDTEQFIIIIIIFFMKEDTAFSFPEGSVCHL